MLDDHFHVSVIPSWTLQDLIAEILQFLMTWIKSGALQYVTLHRIKELYIKKITQFCLCANYLSISRAMTTYIHVHPGHAEWTAKLN